MIPVADLHCDLLCYLEGNPKRTAFDLEVGCSIPQLSKGGVQWQTLAIFTETGPQSVLRGMRQAEIFKTLPNDYQNHFHFGNCSHGVSIKLAIENASSLFGEEEILEDGLLRLTQLHETCKVAYISLTWNTENRFGGGAHTSIGLKKNGMALLDFMSDKKIALDLSHTSDVLAFDCLNYIDKKSLNISVLASHSNFRAITSVARNLPDELVKEIFHRKGVIGLNFVRDFVGADPNNFARHLEHGLKLGGAQNLCLGADFYFGGDVSPAFRKLPEQIFFPAFSSAGAYGDLFELWQTQLGLSKDLIKAIAYENLLNYTETHPHIEKNGEFDKEVFRI